MHKKPLGCFGFFVYGTFGILSGVAEARHDEGLQPDVVKLQDMSPEEKDRRRDECARMFDYCHDWCMKTNKKSRDQRRCVEEECIPKLEECTKKIPHSY